MTIRMSCFVINHFLGNQTSRKGKNGKDKELNTRMKVNGELGKCRSLQTSKIVYDGGGGWYMQVTLQASKPSSTCLN